MPRSGTTFFYRRLCTIVGEGTFIPEETHFLAEEDLTVTLHKFLEDTYYKTLTQPDACGGYYSAWGSSDYFVTEMGAAVALIISASSGRSYIERETIAAAFQQDMNLLRAKSLSELMAKSELVFKKPLSEVNWRAIQTLFSGAKVIFAISIRDPYDTFCSLTRLGWIENFDDFTAMALKSFAATSELLDAGVAVLYDVFADGGATALVEISKRIGIEGEGEGAAQETVEIDNYWINASPESQPVIDRREFMKHFQSHPSHAVYLTLRKRAGVSLRSA